LTKKKVIMNPPDSLVAVGNPSVNEEIEINLGELRSAGFLTTEGQKLDLSKLPPLPDAEIEITAVKDLFEESEVFLGYEGNVLEAFGSAGKNTSQNKSSLLIMATHGFSADETEAQSLPGLLSVAGGKPEIVTSLDVYNFDLKNAVVLLSACSTASGFAERPDTMFTGFVKSISDTGASLIVSSLWPVNTLASRNLTENFVKTWKATNNLNSAFLAGKKMKNPNWTWPFLFIYP
jgi:CHAT domain-containing protein